MVRARAPRHARTNGIPTHAARPPAGSRKHASTGDRDATVSLNVALDSEGSSLLQVLEREVANSPGSAFVGEETVRLARIDTLPSELSLGDERFYLKLDTQGSELAVLRGAEHALRRAELVEAELSLVPLYDRGPLFGEIIDFLRERDFDLISVEGIDEEPETGHMLQLDAIFLRRRARRER
jgi:FkbM family methyltransferase